MFQFLATLIPIIAVCLLAAYLVQNQLVDQSEQFNLVQKSLENQFDEQTGSIDSLVEAVDNVRDAIDETAALNDANGKKRRRRRRAAKMGRQ